MSEYIFSDAKQQAEFERMQLLEEAFDPFTKHVLTHLGLKEGMSCLEAGFGAGSIAKWLVEAVGPKGRVMAVDLNTSYIRDFTSPVLEIHQADLAEAKLGTNVFDFIHSRFVMMHVSEKKKALDNLFGALKPGGWLVLEDADFTMSRPPDDDSISSESFKKVNEAIGKMYEGMGIDYDFGRQLPMQLQKCGVKDIDAETVARPAPGRTSVAKLMNRSVLFVKARLLETGIVSPTDIDNYLNITLDRERSAIYFGAVTAWGRKSK